MTIAETRKVDFIGVDKESQNVVLTISDHLEWIGKDEQHLQLLQEKLNSYLAFIESGEIYDSYPKAKGRPIVIEVIEKFEVPKDALSFLENAKQTIKEAGFELRFRKFEV